MKNWVDTRGQKLAQADFNPNVDTYVFDRSSSNCIWNITNTVQGVKVTANYGTGGRRTIQLNSDMTVTGKFDDQAANLIFAGGNPISLAAAGMAGMNVNWAGTTLSVVPVTLGAGTTTTFNGTNLVFLKRLTVTGGATLAGGRFSVSQLVVSSGGVFGVHADTSIGGAVLAGDPAASITNNGTFQKTAGAGTLSVAPAFVNQGKFIITSGTVSLGVASQNAGTSRTRVQSGATLKASSYQVNGGEFYGGNNATFTGQLQMNAGILWATDLGPVPSTFTINGKLMLASAAQLGVMLSGNNFSQFVVRAQADVGQGNVILAGPVGNPIGAKLLFFVDNGSLPTPGRKPFLTFAGGRVGNFSSWNSNATQWLLPPPGGLTAIQAVTPIVGGIAVDVVSRAIRLPPPPIMPPAAAPPAGAGKVGGMAWADDGNGARDPGEAPAAGVAVYLLDSTGQALASTLTDANGAYEFDGLAAGTYTVLPQLPAGTLFTGYEQSSDPALGSDIDPGTGESAPLVLATASSQVTANIGLLTGSLLPFGGETGTPTPTPPDAVPDAPAVTDPLMTAAIYGEVFFDANHNGQQDLGEVGGAGIAVTLLAGQGTAGASGVTNAAGFYAFDGLAVGTYQVQVALPGGFVFTAEHAAVAGPDSDVDSTGRSDPIGVGSVYDIDVVNAGLAPPYAATMSLSPGASVAVPGAAVTFTAAVSPTTPGGPTPTGSVVFSQYGVTLGVVALSPAMTGAQATFTISFAATGDQPVTANYLGDPNYAANSAGATVTVQPRGTTTSLSENVSTSLPGQEVDLTAAVWSAYPGTALSGLMDFYADGSLLGSASVAPDGMGGYRAFLPTSSLALGQHALTARYEGDATDAASTSVPLNETVQKAATTTSLGTSSWLLTPGQSVTLTATVAPSGTTGMMMTGTPTGTVTFKFADAAGNVLMLGTGTLTPGMYGTQATFTTSSLPQGVIAVTAIYGGDATFAGSNAGLTETVQQLSTSTSLSDSTSYSAPGQPVTFTATVRRGMMMGMAGVLTGTVAFETADGTVLDTEPVAAGMWGGYQASWTTSTLPLGVDTVLAVYSGHTDDAASASPPLTETVAQVGTSTSLSSSANPAIPGQQVTFTATVSSTGMTGMMMTGTPTGTVAFTTTDAAGNVLLLGTGTLAPGGYYGSPQATFTTAALPTGDTAVTATYSGDATFAGSNAGLDETVRQLTPSVGLSANNTSTYLGTSVTFTASVWGAWWAASPTGTVTFRDGATDLATVGLTPGLMGLQATYATSSLGVGSHAITAVYNGDVAYVSATSPPLNEVVTRPTAAVNLWADTTSTVVGGQVMLRATVFGAYGSTTPTGTVTFFAGATALGTAGLDATMMEAGAVLDTSSLLAGTNVITAVYNGDAVYLSATSYPLSVSVSQPTASVAVGASSQYVTAGQPVTLTASVWGTWGAASPTGSVTFFDGTTALATVGLSGGGMTGTQATYTTSSLAVGSHAITAVYSGDGLYAAATSPPTTLTAHKEYAEMSFALGQGGYVAGQPVTLTAVVTSDWLTAADAVTFYLGATALGTVPLTLTPGQGVATLTVLAPPVGDLFTLTADYGGNATVASYQISITL